MSVLKSNQVTKYPLAVNLSKVTLFHKQTISYSCFGDPDGQPAFYLHGLPGSRLEAELLHKSCLHNRIKLIAPDRFGYGQSTPSPKNHYTHWAECINALADRLNFDKFYIFAISGGGPYALACASILDKRVIATTISGGLGPLVQPELRAQMQRFTALAIGLARISPTLLNLSYGLTATLAARHFSRLAIRFLSLINGEPDRSTMLQPDILQMLVRNMRCAFTQGPRGAVADLVAANEDWPFDLSRIRNLNLIAGDRDKVVPCSHSQWLHQQVIHSKLLVVPGEGHFSLPYHHPELMLESVHKDT